MDDYLNVVNNDTARENTLTEIEISNVLEFMKELQDDIIEITGIPMTKTNLYRGVPNNREHKLVAPWDEIGKTVKLYFVDLN